MIELRDVHAGYGDTPILHGVSAHVTRGEILGAIGPNGSGKTTLLRVVAGTLRPNAGEVLLDGTPLRRVPRRTRAQTMAFLMQNASSEFPFTVREIVEMGRAPHLGRFATEKPRDREVIEQALRDADVLSLADRPVTELSGGERQRAFIAMCLAQEPRLLLLDEPTNHLDIGHQVGVLDLVRRLARRDGLTVLGVFHDLNLAAEYCDRLLLLESGKVCAAGKPRDVLTAELIERVYGVRVTVQPNPQSGRPHAILSGGGERTLPK